MDPEDQLQSHERWVVTLGITIFFLGAYGSSPYVTFGMPVHHGGWPIDSAIPFLSTWSWLYVWALPAVAAPAFLTSSKRLFRRTALAYALAIAASVLVFDAWPETARALRPSTNRLDLRRASEWLVANIYAVDPPGNLLPSLHVSLTGLSAVSIWKSDRRLGGLALLGAFGVAAAASLVKQHFLLDILVGAALALALTPLLLRGPRAGPIWGVGAVLHLSCASLFYVSLLLAFATGVRLHRCPDVTGACLR